LPAAGARIASIAQANELYVVTRNIKDLARTTSAIVNAFDPP